MHDGMFCCKRVGYGDISRGQFWVGAGGDSHALLAGQTDGRGDPGTAQRGLLQSLLGSRDSFQSPPVRPPAPSPSPGRRRTAWLPFFETPSGLERGESPCQCLWRLWGGDPRGRSLAQPPAASLAGCGRPTAPAAFAALGVRPARGGEDRRSRPAPARPNPPQKLSSAGK